MKSLALIKSFAVILTLVLISSCASSKKMALPCPEPTSQNKNKVTFNQPVFTKRFYKRSHPERKLSITGSRFTTWKKSNWTNHNVTDSSVKKAIEANEPFDYQNIKSKPDFLDNLYASAEERESLHEDMTKSEAFSAQNYYNYFGSDSSVNDRVEVIPINSALPEPPLISYSSATTSHFTLPVNYGLPQEGYFAEKKMEGLSVAGFVISIVGLIIFGIPLGALAIALSAVGLSKIKRNPDRYSGRALAIAGLVLGLIDIIGVFALLALDAI